MNRIFIFVSFFVIGCGNVVNSDSDITSGNIHEKAFKERVISLENKVLEIPEYKNLKAKYKVKKWGEAVKLEVKNPLIKLDDSICFNLDKLQEPWFVPLFDYTFWDEEPVTEASSKEQPYKKVKYFTIQAKMKDLGFPHRDIVKSEIIVDSLQEYLYVRVVATVRYEKSIRRIDTEKLVNIDIARSYLTTNYDEIREISKNDKRWISSEKEPLKYKKWKFDRYNFYKRPGIPISKVAKYIDYDNHASHSDRFWDIDEQLLVAHTSDKYPLDSVSQITFHLNPYKGRNASHILATLPYDPNFNHPPVAHGSKYYPEENFGFHYMVSSLSTPRLPEVLDIIDSEIKRLQTPC